MTELIYYFSSKEFRSPPRERTRSAAKEAKKIKKAKKRFQPLK